MLFDPFRMKIHQTDLLGLSNPISSRIEFSADIWIAAESISSPDPQVRMAGLDHLEQCKAASKFPLVAYVLTTRLCDPDLKIRARVVKLLADVIQPQNGSMQASEDVKQQIHTTLSQMRNRQVFALVEAAESDQVSHSQVAVLLEYCSFSGKHLAMLLSERKISLSLRKTALQFIERIGYLDALPTLERLERRLKSKVNGQKEFDEDEEGSLIPLLQEAMISLQAP